MVQIKKLQELIKEVQKKKNKTKNYLQKTHHNWTKGNELQNLALNKTRKLMEN